MSVVRFAVSLALAVMCGAASLGAQAAPSQPVRVAVPREDSVNVRFVNTDLRSATQLMSQYLDRPLLFSGQGTSPVTLETPRPVPRADVINLLRGLLDSQNFELFADTAAHLYRARLKALPPTPARQFGQMDPPLARQQGSIELFVLPLKHMRAVDIAATLNALYGRAVSFGDGRFRSSTLGDELRANQIPPAGMSPSNPGGNPSISVPAGELTIIPNAHANSLLVRSSRADYDLIHAVVEQLDVRPLQVMIEVMIAEVRRDKLFAINMDAGLGDIHLNHGDAPTLSGTLGTTGVGDFALKVMGIGGLDLNATLSIAASHGDARILSRPLVITANNVQAEIVVGTQRPFVQVSRTLPTDAGARDQIVQYKDVGTKLTVKPTISSDGLVQLEVSQEVSNATSETQFNAPIISTRSVQTQLLIRDGQTVVLGGLSDTEREAIDGGIPLLSRIPLIGGLFGHSSRHTVETELFVFLTPRVIRTDDDAERLTVPLRVKAERVSP
ncbi:MAG: secretin N-terminal domain-containing protein [bacterium]